MKYSSFEASKSIQQIFTLTKKLLGNDSKSILRVDVSRASNVLTDTIEKTRSGQCLRIPERKAMPISMCLRT